MVPIISSSEISVRSRSFPPEIFSSSRSGQRPTRYQPRLPEGRLNATRCPSFRVRDDVFDQISPLQLCHVPLRNFAG